MNRKSGRKNKGSVQSSKEQSNYGQDTNLQQFKPLFEEMFVGAKYARVNPFACIRIVKIRPITAGGVCRLISLFRKNYKHVDDTCSTGLTFGTDTPIVVQLTGELEHLLVDHFKEDGLSDGEIQETISRHSIWYGIIDGGHSNEAVKKLSTIHPEWRGFQWFVTIINGGFPIDRYRQLARAQNTRHSSRFYIELTFFDQLNNLRLEYERLLRLQSKPSQVQVARSYFGTEDVSNTKKFMASMAIRLPLCTLQEIGIIINTEMPDECLKHESFDSCGAKSSDEILRTTDCRIFRSFVTLHSLRMSTIFMNATTPTEIKAQINTLHRAKEYCLLNGLKTVQYTIINEQFKMALQALVEEKKFLDYLGSSEWPAQMNTTRMNLLQSTLLDNEVEANKGNEHTVLKSLRQSLMIISPNLMKECDERLKLSTEESASSEADPPDLPNTEPTSDDTVVTPTVADSESLHVPADPKESSEEIEKRCLDETLDKLGLHGINCANMDWRTYVTSVWNSESPRADTIVTEPPPITSRTFLGTVVNPSSIRIEDELSAEEVTEMPILAKRLLKPGGYVVLILKCEEIPEWFVSFRKAGYTVMEYPYVFGYKPDSIQDRNPLYLPQCGADFGLIAYLPAEDQFRPDFKAVFAEVGKRSKRNLAILSDIPAPKSKLCRPGTRSPFITTEKSVKLLMEAIDLFTPKGGLTIDIYGGTFTTPMAALVKGRRCLSIEKKPDLFKAAVKRLGTCLPSANIANKSFIPFNDVQFLDIEAMDLEGEQDETGSLDVPDGVCDGQSKRNITTGVVLRRKNEINSNESKYSRKRNREDPSITSNHDIDTTVPGDGGLLTLAAVANQDSMPQKPGFKRVRKIVPQDIDCLIQK